MSNLDERNFTPRRKNSTQLLINAQTGHVPIRRFSMSGYATYQELGTLARQLESLGSYIHEECIYLPFSCSSRELNPFASFSAWISKYQSQHRTKRVGRLSESETFDITEAD